MNELIGKSQSKHIILRRIQLSLVLGVSLTVLLGLLGNLFPFRIAKFMFWPALLFRRFYGDSDITATYYYLIGVPLAIPAYSLIIYVYLTIKGLPHRQVDRIDAK